MENTPRITLLLLLLWAEATNCTPLWHLRCVRVWACICASYDACAFVTRRVLVHLAFLLVWLNCSLPVLLLFLIYILLHSTEVVTRIYWDYTYMRIINRLLHIIILSSPLKNACCHACDPSNPWSILLWWIWTSYFYEWPSLLWRNSSPSQFAPEMPSKIFFLIPNIASIILERETFREHEILERNRKKKRRKKALIFKKWKANFLWISIITALWREIHKSEGKGLQYSS